ncbi:uncharacterized protein LOC119613621 [Lucilia sericata]|uniref:uncharacterized protein LOC119613621 n=1 Tax=Lucilia sericata TaxID=13632 RepID=UPI0018A81BCC|nr:uncharacterized protein LOC119613621 [Lucilia sericata]
MTSYKIYTIFMVLFLTLVFINAKPLEDTFQFFDTSEEEQKIRANPTPEQKLLLFTFDNFGSLGKHYGANALEVSRNILKDESLMGNDKPEVLEFKKNLTSFVEKYESNTNPQLMWDIIEIYSDTTEKYAHIADDKTTPESSYILELLNKYNARDIAAKFASEFKTFMDNFITMFEENKEHLEKPMLDWYAKFKTLTEYEDKLDAFTGFLELN